MDLIFKTKRTINLANSCYRREPRLETFRLRNSVSPQKQRWAQRALFSRYVQQSLVTTAGL